FIKCFHKDFPVFSDALFILHPISCFFTENRRSPLFSTTGNCSDQPRRFALFGGKKSHDRRAHSLQKQPVVRFFIFIYFPIAFLFAKCYNRYIFIPL
ncbi:MAG: hypothetical protein IKW18_05425, partial [Clostridia bacterium]|nr:hypothetical protein [Clostridia bacterium]